MKLGHWQVRSFLVLIIYISNRGNFANAEDLSKSITIPNGESYTWSSTNYPELFSCQNQTLDVKTNPGYTIRIIINDLSMNIDDGNILQIDAFLGERLEINNTTEIQSEYYFESDHVVLYLISSDKNKTENCTGFQITLESVDNLVNTTTSEENTITVYIGGKLFEKYDNSTISSLNNLIANMTIEYCSSKGIKLNDTINSSNVNISYLGACPLKWKDSRSCAKMIFGVFTYLTDDRNKTENIFNSTDLSEMWISLAEGYLSKIGLMLYVLNSATSYLTTWLLVFSLVLVIFLLSLLIIKRTISRATYRNAKNRNIDDMTSIWNDKMSINDFPLGPHPLQEVPPYFQSQMRDFEPGKTTFEPPVYSSSDKGRNRPFDFEALDDNDETDIYLRKPPTKHPSTTTYV